MKWCRLLFAVVLCLALQVPMPAQEAAPQRVPEELDLLPSNTFLVFQLRAGDVAKRLQPLGLLNQLQQEVRDIPAEFEKQTGMPLSALERYTMILPDPARFEAANVFTTNQPIDRTKVREAFLKSRMVFQTVGGSLPAGVKLPPQPPPPPPVKVKDRQMHGFTVHVLEQRPVSDALCFLSDRMFVYGDPQVVEAVLKAGTTPDTGTFAATCRRLAPGHAAWMAFNMEQIQPAGRRYFARPPLPFTTLLQARQCFVTLSAQSGLEAKATATFASPEQATAAKKFLGPDLEKVRKQLPPVLSEMKHAMVENPDAPSHLDALLKGLDAGLQNAQIETDGNTLRLTLRHACDEQFQAGLTREALRLLPSRAELLLFATGWAGRGGVWRQVGGMLPAGGGMLRPDDLPRPQLGQTLKRIAAAFEKYRAQHGHYPPPAIYGKDGTPLLSWRVALLPYLGEEALYRQFKLDEPWHSPHNRPLLAKMPQSLGGVGTGADFVQSSCFRMILGPGAAYEGKDGVNPANLANAGQTVLLVETTRYGDSSAWTRPEGFRFGDDWPLPRPTTDEFEKGFYALFADGKVRFVKRDVNEKTFRAMIQKNGPKVEEKDLGEVVK